MARSKRMTDELLEQVDQYIRSLPPKAAKGQAEAAEFLSPAFRFAMKRGYTLDEIQGLVFNEFGLTLQKSKLKKAVAANENPRAGEETAKATKAKRQKQTDTAPATGNLENGSVDADTPSANAGWEKPETQTGEIAASLENSPDNNENDSAAMAKIITPFRVDLNCPKYQKDEAKDLGAKWDQNKMVWYVPEGLDLVPFEKWLLKSLQEYRKDFAIGTEAMSATEKARQILASVSSAEKPPVKRGGFEIIPDTPDGEL